MLRSALNDDEFVATQTPRSASLCQQQSHTAGTAGPPDQECLLVTQVSLPAVPAEALSQQCNQQAQQVQVQEDNSAAQCAQSVLKDVRPPLHPASLQPAEFDIDIEVPVAGL